MNEHVFGKVQTNRALINKYRELFKKNKQGNETFISPRPQPGTHQSHYFALLSFPSETKNRAYFTALKRKYKSLSEDEYKEERLNINFFWEA